MRCFRMRMRVPFRGLSHRAGVVVGGPAGWGEFSPFPDHPVRLQRRWLTAAREAAIQGWPAPLRERIPVNVTVPAVAPDEAAALVEASGCTTAKVKVGDAGEEARVEAVRAALGPGGNVRVDANAAWDVDTAVRRIRVLARYDLEYVEQPVPSVDEMALVRKRVPVPLAADESIRAAPDPRRVDLSEAADIAVLKVSPLGGVRAALMIADAIGLPVVVSSALETSIGLSAGVAFAAALPELPFACGLGTASFLARDITADPLLPNDGAIAVRAVTVDERALAEIEPTGDAARAWHRRVAELLELQREH